MKFSVYLPLLLLTFAAYASEKKHYLCITVDKTDEKKLKEICNTYNNVTMCFDSNSKDCKVSYLVDILSPLENSAPKTITILGPYTEQKVFHQEQEKMIPCHDYDKKPVWIEKTWLIDVVKKEMQRKNACDPIIDNKNNPVGIAHQIVNKLSEPIMCQQALAIITPHSIMMYHESLSHAEDHTLNILTNSIRNSWKESNRQSHTANSIDIILARCRKEDIEQGALIAFIDMQSEQALIGKNPLYLPSDFYNTVRNSNK